MGAGTANVFHYDPEKWAMEDILDFITELGFEAEKSRRMASDLSDVPEDWPLRGYIIKEYDISFEPPYEHPQFGLVGRVDCRRPSSAIFSPEENKKLYSKLKRKFGMKPVDFKKKDRWFGDAAQSP